MSEPVHVSIVLPVLNGAGYIADSIRRVCAALEALDKPFEVLVVCDGSTDGTARRAAAVEDARVTILRYPVNVGKGHSILYGLSNARGRIVGWLDADLDIGPEVIIAAAAEFEAFSIDAVVGSKRHPDSNVVYPWVRRLYSWGYQFVVRALFRVRVRDTQVGAKLFRREMIETVSPLLLIKRFAFDLEVLAVGAEFGFDRVHEIPIRLADRRFGSAVDWRSVRNMLVDTLAIAYRIHLRHWYVRRFASLQRQRMDEQAPLDVVASEDLLQPQA